MWCAMSEEQEVVLSKQDRLALALVAGKTIRDWRRKTAFPSVRPTGGPANPRFGARFKTGAEPPSITRSASWPSAAPLRWTESRMLGKVADSDAVRLKANRSLVTDQIALARHANLEYRLSLIEEDRRAKPGNANRPAL